MNPTDLPLSPGSRRSFLKGAAHGGLLLLGGSMASLLATGCDPHENAAAGNATGTGSASDTGTTGGIPINVEEILRQGGDLTAAIGAGLVAIPELHAEAAGAIISALGGASIAAADILGDVTKYSSGAMIPKERAPSGRAWGSANLSKDDLVKRYQAFQGHSGAYRFPIVQATSGGSGLPVTIQAEDGTNHSLILGKDDQIFETHNAWLHWLIHNGSGRDLQASGNVIHLRCETCAKGGYRVNVMKQNFTPRDGQEVELVRWDQRQPKNSNEVDAYNFHNDHTEAYMPSAEGRENENVRVEKDPPADAGLASEDPWPEDPNDPPASPTGEDTDIPSPSANDTDSSPPEGSDSN